MFRLTSIVQIGSYQFRGGVNEVTIKRSVKEIVDTATIKLPGIGRVTGKDTLPASSIETSKLFKEGDKVSIQLGYNNDNRQEFTGFIRRVTSSIPVLIECEGYAWQLRRKHFVKSWKSVKLKQLLTEIIAGTDIVLSHFIPDLNLTNICLNQGNCLSMLHYLKEKVHLSVYFQQNILYAGIEEAVPGKDVKYRLGWNVIKDDKLKYRLAEDTRVMVKIFVSKAKNNNTPIFQKGDPDGSIINKHVSSLREAGDLNQLADQLLTYAKYTGYEGNITGFLQPYCQPSDAAVIVDRQYDLRGGKYFIVGTEVVFGMDGARRKVHIGRTLTTSNLNK